MVAAARKKVSRTRRKGQFKLRFHHQALPQEYLDHYEASQISLQKKEAEQNKQNKAANNNNNSMEANDKLQAARTNDSVRSWLQKISEFQSEATLPVKQECDIEMIPATPTMSTAIAAGQTKQKPSPRVVSYNDLPYMGEMTLDNSKPRRGRKPKKADICHLIYKNYGTILPGTPKDMMENNEKLLLESAETSKKTDVQSKIIGSLLEKRLTNENKRQSPAKEKQPERNSVPTKIVDGKLQAEPLNLCVRDRSDTLTVSSDDDTDSLLESVRASPLMIAPSETDALLAANLKMSLPNFQSAMTDKQQASISTPETPSTGDSSNPSGYVYWPSAGVFIHPMALYYQKMVDGGGGPSATVTTPTIPTSSSNPSTVSTPAVSPMPQSSPSPPTKREPTAKILIPKNISQLLKQDKSIPATSPTGLISEASSSSSKSTTPAPQKRKRSAIFIPPMPVESSSNHATEVSICKFKFTGGAKPSLQEKKMLSVDSGGNFRYYSGTGDKSMRGYEFFPRESLQQSSLLTGSSAGAFLNTPGEKISLDLPPPSQGISNEVLQIPELPPINPSVSVIPAPAQSHVMVKATNHSKSGHSSDRRKRKSRRSLQREKLEKTFKEKGFLIQTQQLESAEGATYCKFRQLRKFTRYLFRSWKDYLPGDLQQPGQQQQPPTDLSSILPGNIHSEIIGGRDGHQMLIPSATVTSGTNSSNSIGTRATTTMEN